MSLKIKVRVKGQRQLARALQRRGRDAPKALASALFLEGEQIMAKSKRLVPVDTGALRASGHVQPPKITRRRVLVLLGYGGAAAPYAVFVHERPATHTAPTSWKFLEIPMLEAVPGMASRVARRIARDVV